MKPARRQPADDLEPRCPGRTPGQRAVRAQAAAGVVLNKRSARARVERWDERFVVTLAWLLVAVVAVVTIYQTIAWAWS